jgi:hypothetical protein
MRLSRQPLSMRSYTASKNTDVHLQIYRTKGVTYAVKAPASVRVHAKSWGHNSPVLKRWCCCFCLCL